MAKRANADRETRDHDLLALHWPSSPRNILLVKKRNAAATTGSLLEFAKHVHTTYPGISLVLEPDAAQALHAFLPFPVYSPASNSSLAQTVDLVTTFGGDGTILHASSLFAKSLSVPPILSFNMGTLGFLGEWKFADYKSAFRKVYLSSLPATNSKPQDCTMPAGVLLRNRLKVALYSAAGDPMSTIPSPAFPANTDPAPTHALNEVILHRGAAPHLAHISISLAGRHLTHAIADGLIISTPTGSTAYNLSSGGSIIHPLVSSLLLTPICPRSLSFRPLVVPGNMPISLRLGEGNRGRELEISVDGVRRKGGVGVGTEIKVWGEEVGVGEDGWRGGVPILVGSGGGWVGGLNGLLKFNYPFGEEG